MQTTAKIFRQKNRQERLAVLVAEGLLTSLQAELLQKDHPVLPFSIAEHMIENVIGLFPFPLAIVPNILINGRLYDVPMVIEEPSVVAAQAHAAKLVASGGGYQAGATQSIMTTQIQIVDVENPTQLVAKLHELRPTIEALVNQSVAGLVRRGGGFYDMEFRVLQHPEDVRAMIVVHLYINTLDAMGANLVNTAAESCAAWLEENMNLKIVLKILSNLTTSRRAWAQAVVDFSTLGKGDTTLGEEIAFNIVEASKLAEIDPYRAATHNKGIMNGVDAVVLATGNDFRAVEAGAHAFAAQSGMYRALSQWRVKNGQLSGRLELPMAVGIVGGQVNTHPLVKPLLQLLAVTSAQELAQVIVAVGLGQNLAALRALAAEGIQAGHMSMHARAIAIAVGARGDEVAALANLMKHEKNINSQAAVQLLEKLRQP